MKQIKAIVAGVAAAATYLGEALATGYSVDDDVVVGAVIAGLIVWQATYWAPKNSEPAS